MLVRSTAESTANVNPHYLSRLPSERGLKRDVPTRAFIFEFHQFVDYVRQRMPSDGRNVHQKYHVPLSFRSSDCVRALSRKIWEFFEEFLQQGWMRNWLDIAQLNCFRVFFFSFGSRIENCELFENISREDGEKKYCFVYEDWRRSGNFDSRI